MYMYYTCTPVVKVNRQQCSVISELFDFNTSDCIIVGFTTGITDKMASQKTETTEITAESVLETITQDHLQCRICLNTFTDPRFLDCHHTFCRSCLEGLRTSHHPHKQELDCPNCRNRTPLTRRGISGLKANFTMASLIDGITQQKNLLAIQQGGTGVTCSLCHSEAHTVIQCADCNERLCQDCWSDQESGHASHDVGAAGVNSNGTTLAAPKCNEHREYEYRFFCKTCQALICVMCAATSHRGLEHEHEDIDEADDSTRKELCILLFRSEKRLQDYISEKEIVERKRNTMKGAIVDAITTIEKAEEYADSPDKEQVVEKLTEFGLARAVEYTKALDDACAKIEWVQHVSETITRQVASAGKFELLQRKEELVLNMKYMLGRAIRLSELSTLVYVNVKPTRSPKHAGQVQVIPSYNTWYMYEDEIETTIPVTARQMLYWVKVKL